MKIESMNNRPGDGAGTHVRERKSDIPMTVLRRPGGKKWSPIEVTILRTHLGTNVVGHPSHPEYLVAKGHFAVHDTFPTGSFRAAPHTAVLTYGPSSEDIPFVPRIV